MVNTEVNTDHCEKSRKYWLEYWLK